MPRVDLTEVQWRKSSFSGGSGSNGACVEVAFSGPAVAIRDSKAPEAGTLAFPAAAWARFGAHVSTRGVEFGSSCSTH